MILEPKKEPCDNCNNDVCCCTIKKQETFEEAAKEIFKGEYICNGIDIVPAWREGFEVGAKSDAARYYWFEQFKKTNNGK